MGEIALILAINFFFLKVFGDREIQEKHVIISGEQLL